MEDLSLFILDIAMNAVRAGATAITIEIVEQSAENLLTFTVQDNGGGMTEEQLAQVHDPYFTTRTTRRVGLGIPLLKQAAEQAGGGLDVTSRPGEGTTVVARFGHDHIDRPPLGDVAASIWTLVVTNPDIDFVYVHRRDGACFEVRTRELKETLATRSLGSARVAGALRKYFQEGEKRIARADRNPARDGRPRARGEAK